MFFTKDKEKELEKRILKNVKGHIDKYVEEEVEELVDEKLKSWVDFFTSYNSIKTQKSSVYDRSAEEKKRNNIHDRIRALFLKLVRDDRKLVREKMLRELKGEVLSKDTIKDIVSELNSIQLDSKK